MKVQSAVRGQIRRILFILGKHAATDFNEMVRDFYSKKSSHTQITVWSVLESLSTDLEDYLNVYNIKTTNKKHNLSPDTILIVPIEKQLNVKLQVWSRDPYFILVDQGLTKLVEYPFTDDGAIGLSQVELAINYQLVNEIKPLSNCYFQGGDILADDNFVIINGYAFDELLNLKKTGSTVEVFLGELSKVFGVRRSNIYPMGSFEFAKYLISKDDLTRKDEIIENKKRLLDNLFSIQTWNYEFGDRYASRVYKKFVHIDLFLSIGGSKINGLPVLFLGKAYLLYSYQPIIGNEKMDSLNEALDEIENNLKNNFFIIRNPIPYYESRDKRFFLLYNNCLVERTTDESKVWLPSYQCDWMAKNLQDKVESYERLIESLWEIIDVEAIFIKSDFVDYAIKSSGFHCLVNEIREL